MTDWREDRIGSALRGENPTVIARMPGGFAVMGDPQWLPGYCVLLTDNPKAERLSDLSNAERSAYLGSMADLGEAVERACREADPAFRVSISRFSVTLMPSCTLTSGPVTTGSRRSS